MLYPSRFSRASANGSGAEWLFGPWSEREKCITVATVVSLLDLPLLRIKTRTVLHVQLGDASRARRRCARCWSLQFRVPMGDHQSTKKHDAATTLSKFGEAKIVGDR